MKNILYALIILLFSCIKSAPVLSQPATWAQAGAHWYYSEGDNVGGFGYFEIWEDGDTLINGVTCDVLRTYREGIIFVFPGGPYSQTGPTWYTYQSNDTVYIYYGNQFNILFIDNQAPGDEFICGPEIYGLCDGDTITIDSLYSVTLSGFTMNKIVPVVPDWWDGQWPPGGASVRYHEPIYTRFGSTGFFIPAPNCVTDVAFGPLRCYSDSTGFSFTTNVTPTCDYITSVSEPEPQKPFSIYPNPATDEIYIFSDHTTSLFTLEVYQADGKLKGVYEITDDQKSIDISSYHSGLYFVRIKNRPQMKPVRFVKL